MFTATLIVGGNHKSLARWDMHVHDSLHESDGGAFSDDGDEARFMDEQNMMGAPPPRAGAGPWPGFAGQGQKGDHQQASTEIENVALSAPQHYTGP